MDIKIAAFDIDGVMTDGKIIISRNGESHKNFHAHDGYGIKLLLESNIIVAFITGRKSAANVARAQELGVTELHQGIQDKITCLQALCEKHKIPLQNCAYTGDDIPDLACIEKAGVGIAVANAVPTLKSKAKWVTKNTGGNGAVREVCDWILSHET